MLMNGVIILSKQQIKWDLFLNKENVFTVRVWS